MGGWGQAPTHFPVATSPSPPCLTMHLCSWLARRHLPERGPLTQSRENLGFLTSAQARQQQKLQGRAHGLISGLPEATGQPTTPLWVTDRPCHPRHGLPITCQYFNTLTEYLDRFIPPHCSCFRKDDRSRNFFFII